MIGEIVATIVTGAVTGIVISEYSNARFRTNVPSTQGANGSATKLPGWVPWVAAGLGVIGVAIVLSSSEGGNKT